MTGSLKVWTKQTIKAMTAINANNDFHHKEENPGTTIPLPGKS